MAIKVSSVVVVSVESLAGEEQLARMLSRPVGQSARWRRGTHDNAINDVRSGRRLRDTVSRAGDEAGSGHKRVSKTGIRFPVQRWVCRLRPVVFPSGRRNGKRGLLGRSNPFWWCRAGGWDRPWRRRVRTHPTPDHPRCVSTSPGPASVNLSAASQRGGCGGGRGVVGHTATCVGSIVD